MSMETEIAWYLAERDSADWIEAWAALVAEFGDAACHDPESGESWQYMGTENHGGSWTHCFRHRALNGGDRVYRHYPAMGPAGGEA
jgi:hypothetical protein